MTANNGTHLLAFHYDDKGIRTSKTANGVTTSYTSIDGRITGQYNGTDRLYFRYDNGNKLTGLRWNSDEYLYVSNPQGDITEILDMSGNIVVIYSYDAWGNVLTTAGPMAGTLGQLNPFRYRGYCLDTETGLYYLQSRYYDPATGRFINVDEPSNIEFNNQINANLYAYCGNNPIMHIDSQGRRYDDMTPREWSSYLKKVIITDINSNQEWYSYSNWEQTQGFGGNKGHLGNDLCNMEGEIRAISKGVVKNAGCFGANGYTVTIQCELKIENTLVEYYVLYSHMKKDSLVVRAGQEVISGQLLGYMGNTGNSKGAHLHLGVYRGTYFASMYGYSRSEFSGDHYTYKNIKFYNPSKVISTEGKLLLR